MVSITRCKPREFAEQFFPSVLFFFFLITKLKMNKYSRYYLYFFRGFPLLLRHNPVLNHSLESLNESHDTSREEKALDLMWVYLMVVHVYRKCASLSISRKMFALHVGNRRHASCRTSDRLDVVCTTNS